MGVESIFARLDAVPGKVGCYYKNLVTGEEYSRNGNDQFLAASVIKLPVFAAVAKMVAEGRASWDERLPIRPEEMVPSCGTLRFIAGEVDALSVRALSQMMIVVSDNSATNAIMRRFGIEALNREFLAMGLEKTHIERLLFDRSEALKGRNNRIVPREMGSLLERIYRHTFVSAEASAFLEDTLLDQQINHKIPGYLGDVDVAHKTGEDGGITNDVGVVYAREPFVLAFAFNETDVPEAERAMREISLALVEAQGE